jgi:cell wall-associated protease
MKYGILFLAFIVAAPAMAARTLAVIDSGVDYRHSDLRAKVWVNPFEIARNEIDEDGNGLVDDIYGWNFAEKNNLVIDYKYLGTFTNDPYKFFEIQAKMFLGTATEEDKAWLAERRSNQEFITEMGKFGNFIHGTHVAGIAMKDAKEAKLLSIKIIPTEVNPFGKSLAAQAKGLQNDELRLNLMKKGLELLAKQQMKMLVEVANYAGNNGAIVANGSFGTGFAQAKMIVEMLFQTVVGREPNEGEIEDVARHFMNALVFEGRKMVQASSNTLFVFAAGNDGTNNDLYPTSPANIEAPNVISVAATFERNDLATFSNFGAKTVDVAAPGVIIDSTIPGDEYLKVSGTSQAAPYIANIALAIAEANPSLVPLQIKKVLLGTVDNKDFLTGKVKTGGIANVNRALKAATLAQRMDLDSAIKMARETVADEPTSKESYQAVGNGVVLPLPSLLQM